jgi:DNA-binding NarL/FixJ family response regulator
LQVLEFLRQGMGNSEMAGHLGISQKTVGTYKARLMEKMGVRTTPELLMRVQGR